MDGTLPSKLVFYQRLISIGGSFPLKYIFHARGWGEGCGFLGWRVWDGGWGNQEPCELSWNLLKYLLEPRSSIVAAGDTHTQTQTKLMLRTSPFNWKITLNYNFNFQVSHKGPFIYGVSIFFWPFWTELEIDAAPRHEVPSRFGDQQ